LVLFQINMAKHTRFTILQLLLIILIFVGIGPLLTAVYKLIGTNKDYLQTSELQLQLSIVDNISSNIYQYVINNKDRLNNFALSLKISGINEKNKLNSFIENIKEGQIFNEMLQNSQLLSIMIVNIEAKGVSAGEIIKDEGLNKLTENAFNVSIRGQQYISDPYIIKEKIIPVIIIGIPLKNLNNEPIGSLLGTLSLQPMLNLVEANSKSQIGRKVFVTDDKGYLFLDSNKKLLLEHPLLTNNKIVNDFLTKGAKISNVATYEIEKDNKKIAMIGTYKAVPEYNWGVFVQVEKDYALAIIDQMVKEAIKWSIFSAAIAIILGIIFARMTSSPIRSLAEFAISIAKERNFHKKIEVKSTYEIQQLATTFNQMTDEISNYIISLKKAAEENRELFLNSIKMLVAAIDAKDPYTKGHSERVTFYSVTIGEYLNLPETELDKIQIGALLHDVGKIGIDDRILRKPEALTNEEFQIMKTHPEKGAKIMSQIPQLKDMLPGMHFHHEFWDGTGYPLGLKGEEIPLIARIIGLADTFDAMTTERPYQAPMHPDKALEKIQQFSNIRFDPKVVRAFVSAYKHGKFDKILKKEIQVGVK